MAGPLRIEFPGALYHVISRGNERCPVVRDDEDRAKRLDCASGGPGETAGDCGRGGGGADLMLVHYSSSDPRSLPGSFRCANALPHFVPMQYRYLSERMKRRPAATAGLALNAPRSPSSFVARSLNSGAAATTNARPPRDR